MKYVMFRVIVDEDATAPAVFIPVIFPPCLVHCQVASALMPLMRFQFHETTIVSAGDVSLFGAEICTTGESETLKLKSRPEDAMIIHNYPYSHGIEDNWMDDILAKAGKPRQ